ncbi:hypothetical protein EJB05_08412 [Eragrostis curvula]|uniref:Uncharacterized protein n=1 Tax=Eragrostis curvula TaxID=38414 RepID=A0A5J9W403_9POAL|nr:hypothetical protein EJB05_08412 [Eragrostis curvula]
MPSPSPFVSWSSSGEPALSVSTSGMDRSDGARTRGTTLLASVTTTMWPSPRTRPARAGKRASAASDARGRTARGSSSGSGGMKKRSMQKATSSTLRSASRPMSIGVV